MALNDNILTVLFLPETLEVNSAIDLAPRASSPSLSALQMEIYLHLLQCTVIRRSACSDFRPQQFLLSPPS